MKILVSVVCNPTENEEKIYKILIKFFPRISFRIEGNLIVGESTSLESMNFIIDNLLSRNLLFPLSFLIEKNIENNKTFFYIQKQPAILGKLHLASEDDALGNILIEITDFEEFKKEINDLMKKSEELQKSI